MAAYAFECHGHPSGAHEWNIHQSGAHEWNTHRNMQRSSEHHYQRGPGHMQQAAPWEPREHTYRQPTWEPRERTHCQPGYVGPPCAPAGLSPLQINTAIIQAANTGNIRMLIQVIHHHLPNMNMVNLSTALYRCGKLAADNSHTRNMLASDPVVRRLLEVVFSSLQCMDPATPPCQAISNIAWALASMQRLEQELMGLIAHLSLASIHRFKFFELSSLLWAFAKLEAQSFLREQTCALFDMATAQLEGNLRGLQLRTLSTISWAFATAKHIHIGFFRSLAQEIHRQGETRSLRRSPTSSGPSGRPGRRTRACWRPSQMLECGRFTCSSPRRSPTPCGAWRPTCTTIPRSSGQPSPSLPTGR
jgi:hypothetical protein